VPGCAILDASSVAYENTADLFDDNYNVGAFARGKDWSRHIHLKKGDS